MKKLKIIGFAIGLFISIQLGCYTIYASTTTQVPVEGIIKKQQIPDKKAILNSNQSLPKLSENTIQSELFSLAGVSILLFIVCFNVSRRKNTNEKV
ncbi:hypothetical protein [Enterococcus sp. DIV1368e]|uniref:hypothetical protein n=1 Tax=unclassified Enterococcus TaxID=2608891 RepID=UPI003F683CF9